MSKFHGNLKMSRKDVEVDQCHVHVPNSSWLGFSKGTLRPGDFFVYLEHTTRRLGRMHYRIAQESQRLCDGFIVAQVAINSCLSNHCERWVSPMDVLETIPADRVEPEILALFERKVSMWD